MDENLRVNSDRLMKNLEDLARFGLNEEGGIDRWFGSETDLEARKFILDLWKDAFPGAGVRVDAIGNLWADLDGSEDLAPIVIGSHHDAVPSGGKYDGALGVLMATEIARTLREHDIRLRHPLKVVSFTGEEPNPFNVSTLGSKVLCGRLTEQDLMKLSDRDTGQSMESAVKAAGGDIHKVKKLEKGSMAAFLECHIEQGHRLEDMGLPTAAVTAITGIYREEITCIGEANHAGTTVIGDRKDAFLAAADLALLLEKELKKYPDGSLVGTIGHVEVVPGEANIIPGRVKVTLDVRTCREPLLRAFLEKLDGACRDVEARRKIQIVRRTILDQTPMKMDPAVIDAVRFGIRETGYEPVCLESMAGHDAANMARLTRAGMIFVMSRDGKSHCKEEYTPPDQIRICADAMLKAVLRLDETLDRENSPAAG